MRFFKGLALISLLLLASGAQAQVHYMYFQQLASVAPSAEMSGTLSDDDMTMTWSGDGTVYTASLTGTMVYTEQGRFPAMIAEYNVTTGDLPYQIVVDNSLGIEYVVEVVDGQNGPVFAALSTDPTATYYGTFDQASTVVLLVVQTQSENVEADLQVEFRVCEGVPNDQMTMSQIKALYK